jgi:hypothetical protein
MNEKKPDQLAGQFEPFHASACPLAESIGNVGQSQDEVSLQTRSGVVGCGIHDYPVMPQVERNVLDVLRQQNDRFAQYVSNAKFIKHVRIFAGKIRDNGIGFIQPGLKTRRRRGVNKLARPGPGMPQGNEGQLLSGSLKRSPQMPSLTVRKLLYTHCHA